MCFIVLQRIIIDIRELYSRYLLFDESLVIIDKIPLTVINYFSSTTSFMESELNNFLLHIINLNEKLLASFLKLD